MKFLTGQKIYSRNNPEIEMEILGIDDVYNQYRISYVKTPIDLAYLKNYNGMFFDGSIIDNDCELVDDFKYVNKVTENKKENCVCSSVELFQRGCKCGYIVPYKANWK